MSDNREDFHPPATAVTYGDYDVLCYSCEKHIAEVKLVIPYKTVTGAYVTETRYECRNCYENELYNAG